MSLITLDSSTQQGYDWSNNFPQSIHLKEKSQVCVKFLGHTRSNNKYVLTGANNVFSVCIGDGFFDGFTTIVINPGIYSGQEFAAQMQAELNGNIGHYKLNQAIVWTATWTGANDAGNTKTFDIFTVSYILGGTPQLFLNGAAGGIEIKNALPATEITIVNDGGTTGEIKWGETTSIHSAETYAQFTGAVCGMDGRMVISNIGFDLENPDDTNFHKFHNMSIVLNDQHRATMLRDVGGLAVSKWGPTNKDGGSFPGGGRQVWYFGENESTGLLRIEFKYGTVGNDDSTIEISMRDQHQFYEENGSPGKLAVTPEQDDYRLFTVITSANIAAWTAAAIPGNLTDVRFQFSVSCNDILNSLNVLVGISTKGGATGNKDRVYTDIAVVAGNQVYDDVPIDDVVAGNFYTSCIFSSIKAETWTDINDGTTTFDYCYINALKPFIGLQSVGEPLATNQTISQSKGWALGSPAQEAPFGVEWSTDATTQNWKFITYTGAFKATDTNLDGFLYQMQRMGTATINYIQPTTDHNIFNIYADDLLPSTGIVAFTFTRLQILYTDANSVWIRERPSGVQTTWTPPGDLNIITGSFTSYNTTTVIVDAPYGGLPLQENRQLWDSTGNPEPIYPLYSDDRSAQLGTISTNVYDLKKVGSFVFGFIDAEDVLMEGLDQPPWRFPLGEDQFVLGSQFGNLVGVNGDFYDISPTGAPEQEGSFTTQVKPDANIDTRALQISIAELPNVVSFEGGRNVNTINRRATGGIGKTIGIIPSGSETAVQNGTTSSLLYEASYEDWIDINNRDMGLQVLSTTIRYADGELATDLEVGTNLVIKIRQDPAFAESKRNDDLVKNMGEIWRTSQAESNVKLTGS
tara:strand:- start:4848 stop:7427 length:2580 start_codon:yes stop_codon:yes gene_type:complete